MPRAATPFHPSEMTAVAASRIAASSADAGPPPLARVASATASGWSTPATPAHAARNAAKCRAVA
eukprot:7376159-Prymnesium_polylepis.1